MDDAAEGVDPRVVAWTVAEGKEAVQVGARSMRAEGEESFFPSSSDDDFDMLTTRRKKRGRQRMRMRPFGKILCFDAGR